jgi:hypothetical protein
MRIWPHKAFHRFGEPGPGTRRPTRVKASLVVLVVLAACSGPVQDASPRVASPVSTTVREPETLSARIVMSSTTIRAGATVDAQVIVENNTGNALQVTGCGSLFAVALGNDNVEPDIVWTLCAQPLTVPVGESIYPVTVRATYGACGDGGTLRPCGTEGRLPGLPPGRYQARLYQNPVVVPAPPPISIEVTR